MHSTKVYLITLQLKVSFKQRTCNFQCNWQLSMWVASSDWKFCVRNSLGNKVYFVHDFSLLQGETIDRKHIENSEMFSPASVQGGLLIHDQLALFRPGGAIAFCKTTMWLHLGMHLELHLGMHLELHFAKRQCDSIWECTDDAPDVTETQRQNQICRRKKQEASFTIL